MAELNIQIGGRAFTVSCQDGEEHFLQAAATMLDREAQPLVAQMGRITEAKMLLMAGLLLADRTAAIEDQCRQLQGKVAELEARAGVRVEVAVIPPLVQEIMADIAARSEALAAALDEKQGPERG
jgi:cell division protein ZapA